MHTFFSFISIILTSACFEQRSLSSGVYFCTRSIQYFHACMWCLVANTLWLEHSTRCNIAGDVKDQCSACLGCECKNAPVNNKCNSK